MPAPVAAERDVKVFAQPGRKRDVPAPPEIGDRFRAVGRIEIFREDEAEHEAEPDRHVGVTAEVEINLEGVADGAEPRVERADRAGVEGRVGYFSAGVREQDFLRQAEHEEGDAAREFVRGEDAMFELVGEKGEFQDRPRDEMREHGNEAGEIDEVRHRLGLAAIDVDRVAERLEGVEADAERQDDAEEGVELRVVKSEPFGQGVPALDPEVEVLEESEDREIQDDRDPNGVALGPGARRAARQLFHRLAQDAPESPGVVRDDQTHQPVDERGREHQRHEARLGPSVKDVAGQDEPAVAPALRRADEQVVAQQRERQEVVDKNVRTKNHAGIRRLKCRLRIKNSTAQLKECVLSLPAFNSQ